MPIAAHTGAPTSRRAFVGGIGAAAVAGTLPAGAYAAPQTEFFAKRTPGSSATVDHAAWDAMLKAYVTEHPDGVNRVRYAALKAEARPKLKAYVKALEAVDPASLDASEQFAFWANLYNAKTVDIIVDHYPVKSIREISIDEGLFGFIKRSAGLAGPWKAKVMKVAGQDLTLDNVEHDILRPIFKDPRVHYAVNCASFGCPNLPRTAFTGASLEPMLETGARTYVNHPRGFMVEGGKVKASSIYEWFQVDFGGSVEGVLAHARKYAGPQLAKQLEGVTAIASYDYDWSLNEAKP